MSYIIQLTDQLPDGKLELTYVREIGRDEDGTINHVSAGSRDEAVAFSDRAVVIGVAAVVLDSDPSFDDTTYVGVRRIQL